MERHITRSGNTTNFGTQFFLGKLLLVFVSLATAVSVWAGGGGSMDGGGGDNLPVETDSAWFLGGKSIRYCYVESENFGVSRERIESAIEAGFSRWQTYVQGGRIHAELPPDWQLAFHRELLPVCDGTEDLKFYFGLITPEVQAAEAAYVNPVAFSRRTSYDAKVGWGKGFIWLGDPDTLAKTQPNSHLGRWPWGQSHAIETQLLHELGHVYGCGHIDGTIMRPDIAQRVFDLEPTIDGKRVLALVDFQFFFKHQQRATYGSKAFGADTFLRFVGAAPSGGCKFPDIDGPCVSVDLISNDSANASPLDIFRVGISLSDSTHSRVVWFEPLNIHGDLSAGSSYAISTPTVFKVARAAPPQWEGGPTVLAKSIPLRGTVIMGRITDAAARSYPAMMTINMNYTGGSIWGGSAGPLGIFYFDGPSQQVLFGR